MALYLKSILALALMFMAIAPVLFGLEQHFCSIAPAALAQQMMMISIIYFAFTIAEFIAIGAFKDKDSSYLIGINLGFSLLRLFLTVGLLFYFKRTNTSLFTLAFINVLVFYFSTLLFSTWHRQKTKPSTTTK